MALDPTTVALIGTIFGGVGLKIVEHWLGKNKVKVDEAAKYRDEQRLEITALRAENKALESDVDKWKLDYYNLRDVVTTLRALLRMNKIDIPPDE